MSVGGILVAAVAVVAATVTAYGDEAGTLSVQQLVERYPELSVNDVSDGPIDGFYEINAGGAISYVSTDGRFLFRGDVVDLETRRNLTEARRAAHRAALLATLDPSTEIVFSPADGAIKHRVTVFTDVDCGYCRQLHREIGAINDLGIEVHYAAYPRTGPNTESWSKAEHVWCAADRNGALTQAKLGADVASAPDCQTTPIATQYALGHALGMTGTPAIYSDTGVELGGYLEPAALLAKLEALAEAP